MSDDEHATSSAAERIAALNARRAAGAPSPSTRTHAAKGARRATLLASVAAVAGLTGGFALHAASNSTASVATANKTVATNTTTAATTATSNSTTASTTSAATAAAITTSQGS
jgi:hypothetical protein